MTFDPKKTILADATGTQPEEQKQDDHHSQIEALEALDQSFGYLDETAPEMPEGWENGAPEPTPEDLARWADESTDVDEPDQAQARAEAQKEGPRTTPAGFLINPRPVIPRPFVEYLFNMNTINEINAGPGVGKTTLLSLLAACVATGKPFLDRFRVKKGISVFFTEDAETVTNCLSAWELEWGVSILDHVLICDKPAALTDTTTVKTVTEIGPGGQEIERVIQLDRPMWGKDAMKQIQEIKQFAGDRAVCMVVYDSKSFHLSSAMRNGKPLDENSNDDQQYITFCGYRFVKALGACGIFVPHVSKESERSPYLILESRGGGAAKGAVWKTFSLTTDKSDKDKVIMAAGKRRGGGISQLLRLTRQSMPIFPAEEAEEYAAAYDSQFDGEILPAGAHDGLRPIDPLYCGGYLNECEIVTEEQLAEEAKAAAEGEKKERQQDKRQRPSASEQDVLDILIKYCNGQSLQNELSRICEERLRKPRSNVLRSIKRLIEKHQIRAFDEPGGKVMLTALNASIPPLSEQ